MILMQMFASVESGAVAAPLFDPATVPTPNVSNQEFLKQYVFDLLSRAFPHLQT